MEGRGKGESIKYQKQEGEREGEQVAGGRNKVKNDFYGTEQFCVNGISEGAIGEGNSQDSDGRGDDRRIKVLEGSGDEERM